MCKIANLQVIDEGLLGLGERDWFIWGEMAVLEGGLFDIILH